MVRIRTTILIALLFTTIIQNAQTIVNGGNVSGTWNVEESPYLIEDNIFIDSGEKLTINPGVSVIFTGDYSMEVHGRLDAAGTENEKILFTLDDTTGFANGNTGWMGIAFLGYDATTYENSQLNHCIVEYSASNGVVCISFSQLEITNSEFRYNKNKGIVLYEFSDINIDGADIHHNGTGGMEVSFSAPQMTDFSVMHNGGTGISINGSSYNSLYPTFELGEIKNNHTDGIGGGMLVSLDASANLKQVIIANNSAALGGGIFAEWGFLTLREVVIRANSSDNGAAMYLDYGSTLSMEHGLITDNNATQNGGGIHVVDAFVDISRSTISNNVAGNSGGALYYDLEFGQSGTISSSILWENTPNEIQVVSNGLDVHHSNIAGGYDGSGNIGEDPLFETGESGDYFLSWADYPNMNGTRSPCIDAGDPAEAYDSDGTVADMGAFSFVQVTITRIDNYPNDVFTVFPNPSSGSITIRGNQETEKVYFLNLSGKVIKILEGRQNNDIIDISQLQTGIYFVQVYWENGAVSTNKLVKE